MAQPYQLTQLFHKIHDVTRFRPDSMIGIYISASHDTFTVDYKPSRHREFPGVVTIESLKIDAETRIHFLEFFRHGKDQTEFVSIFIIFIRQYREGELMLFHNLLRILTQLW